MYADITFTRCIIGKSSLSHVFGMSTIYPVFVNTVFYRYFLYPLSPDTYTPASLLCLLTDPDRMYKGMGSWMGSGELGGEWGVGWGVESGECGGEEGGENRNV